MSNDSVSAVENELVSRVNTLLETEAPGFDPTIITTMMDLLMELLAGCGQSSATITPDRAVERVKNLSGFEKSMLKSRLKKRARQNGVKDADNISPIAVNAVQCVAVSATPDEQYVFAKTVLNIASPDYEMI